MYFAEEDVRFAARHCGMSPASVRDGLGELGFVQLIAAAVPIVMGMLAKRKAKKRAKREEALAKMQAQAMPPSAATGYPPMQPMQVQQLVPAPVAAAPSPPAPRRRAVTRSSSLQKWALPAAVAGVGLVAVLALRKRR